MRGEIRFSVTVGSSTTRELVALCLGLFAIRDHVLTGEMSLGACSGVHVFNDSHVAIRRVDSPCARHVTSILLLRCANYVERVL